MPTLLFTPETARIHALKSHSPESARNKPKPCEQRQEISTLPADESDDYRKTRLMRVRKQLDMIDAEVTKEAAKNPDGKRLKELVEAGTRLDAQEWSLSNRHKPSVAKPAIGKPKRDRIYAEPQPAQPQVELATPQPVTCDPFSEVLIQPDLSSST